MKTRVWLTSGIVAVVTIGLFLARGENGLKPKADPETGALRQQIEQLQARLQKVEARLAQLESATSHAPPRFEVVPNPPGAPPSGFIPAPKFKGPSLSSPPPKIWGEREINGWRFYLIPCGGK